MSQNERALVSGRAGERCIDASVHVFFPDNTELRGVMGEPFSDRGFPDYEMDWYGAPGGEYVSWAQRDGIYPGSDPEFAARQLFGERGIDLAILHPMTRGLMPDRHLGTAIAAAHNEMLARRWLEHETYGERFRGTIRVVPDDIEGALKQIERWKDHPRMVQIGIPLQSHALYGKPQFWPLWEAAADAGLPVAVHTEVGSGIDNAPTPSGVPRTYPHYATFNPLNYLYHLMNMIAEGVFERFGDLKFVFADGAGDLVTPFIWRMDTFGRPHLEQTPWAPEMPSDYLPGHVYFVQGSLDGPGDVPYAGEWLRMTGKEDMVVFGSSYPHWHAGDHRTLPSAWSERQRDKVLFGNAAKLYGLTGALTQETQTPAGSR